MSGDLIAQMKDSLRPWGLFVVGERAWTGRLHINLENIELLLCFVGCVGRAPALQTHHYPDVHEAIDTSYQSYRAGLEELFHFL